MNFFCSNLKIKQASVEKLIERLIDLRFLSIDFLNTFLLTYTVFTDSLTILNSLKKLHESSPRHSINFNNIDMTRYKIDGEKLNTPRVIVLKPWLTC